LHINGFHLFHHLLQSAHCALCFKDPVRIDTTGVSDFLECLILQLDDLVGCLLNVGLGLFDLFRHSSDGLRELIVLILEMVFEPFRLVFKVTMSHFYAFLELVDPIFTDRVDSHKMLNLVS
jgi:hypothetical protein